ncbi:MAG: hypothetical protein WBQ26_04160 [Gemmatimonadaceae bacterium]|nr:hypothetical protein [Gemmatimonadaceae bacterium]
MGECVAPRTLGHVIGQNSALCVTQWTAVYESAYAAPTFHGTSCGELAVSLEDRIGVDPEPGGERADRRQCIAGREVAAGNGGTNRVGDLEEERATVVRMEFEVHVQI